jgi:hypothetical protein
LGPGTEHARKAFESAGLIDRGGGQPLRAARLGCDVAEARQHGWDCAVDGGLNPCAIKSGRGRYAPDHVRGQKVHDEGDKIDGHGSVSYDDVPSLFVAMEP